MTLSIVRLDTEYPEKFQCADCAEHIEIDIDTCMHRIDTENYWHTDGPFCDDCIARIAREDNTQCNQCGYTENDWASQTGQCVCNECIESGSTKL